MPKIEITLGQLKSFLDNIDYSLYQAYKDAANYLIGTADQNVFTTHDDTVHIPTKQDLQRHIRSATGHNPPRTPVAGKEYSPEYLERKQKEGGHYSPHVWRENGFYHGFDKWLELSGGRGYVLKIGIIPPETWENPGGTFKDGSQNYLEHHERRRSVLKTLFLRGWNGMFDTIVKSLMGSLKDAPKRGYFSHGLSSRRGEVHD